eukprot:TRINITY_DN21099_c0_g3_i1.p1 TRINITY_DN21099_c0_g3~~TRINITY_DN21099_c0_g3_i1.p1  ORF type:complete len:191 (-),score=22.96 TRINITY_DN21099_c0_g3_i1:59-631(-)
MVRGVFLPLVIFSVGRRVCGIQSTFAILRGKSVQFPSLSQNFSDAISALGDVVTKDASIVASGSGYGPSQLVPVPPIGATRGPSPSHRTQNNVNLNVAGNWSVLLGEQDPATEVILWAAEALDAPLSDRTLLDLNIEPPDVPKAERKPTTLSPPVLVPFTDAPPSSQNAGPVVPIVDLFKSPTTMFTLAA